MKTSEREAYDLRDAYQGAFPSTLAAAERLHIAMGIESEAFDGYGQLVVVPWHMPMPGELQHQSQLPNRYCPSTGYSIVIAGRKAGFMPYRDTETWALSQHNKRGTASSNHLERSLHNKNLAQRLSLHNPGDPVPLRVRDVNLPLQFAGVWPSTMTNGVMDNMLKRKLSKIKLPSAPKDEQLSGAVPNLSIQPAFQHKLRILRPAYGHHDTPDMQKMYEHRETSEYKERSDSPSPPRRRSMPPIEVVLAHGFRNITLARPIQANIPRSHAYDPWTDLPLGHKILSPTPVFLLNMTPFQLDDSEETQYWKPSLPMLLSYHLANPATLIEETPIQSLTFHLPAPKPTLASTGNRKQPSRASKQLHYKTEGSETGTEVRMIRMILPPLVNSDGNRSEDVPYTDWLILCCSDITPAQPPSTSTRVLRSASRPLRQAYLLLAFPTQAISETSFVASNSCSSPTQQTTITTILGFTGRGRLPLAFGVGRDVSFADKWIRGFGMGVAALEVTTGVYQRPCWL
ncbi:hypothetical protein QM012_005853 [Aureobasidium pullulans]|uniref:Uncharacterized protein n=1 Tax=Aureobasidium pullulans TaxID=5580 RepID=A0ABR0TSK1_AURPU